MDPNVNNNIKPRAFAQINHKLREMKFRILGVICCLFSKNSARRHFCVRFGSLLPAKTLHCSKGLWNSNLGFPEDSGTFMAVHNCSQLITLAARTQDTLE